MLLIKLTVYEDGTVSQALGKAVRLLSTLG